HDSAYESRAESGMHTVREGPVAPAGPCGGAGAGRDGCARMMTCRLWDGIPS
ncbi:hypothetical protein L249_0624, partial [Ophiocordyceps polyrhachis-furcata BCC 54312]